jgi:hypothetical protein
VATVMFRRDRRDSCHVNTASMKIGKDACSISRVPAGEVEAAVIAQVRKVLQAPEVMSQAIREVVALDPTADAQETILTLQSIEPVWDELFPAEQARIIQLLVERVTVSPTGLRIDMKTAGMKELIQSVIPEKRRQRDGQGRSRLGRSRLRRNPDDLQEARRAQGDRSTRWHARQPAADGDHRQHHDQGSRAGISLAEIAGERYLRLSGRNRQGGKIGPSFVSRVIRLALLAPDIVEAILAGKQPAHLTLRDLMQPFPVEWAGQRLQFGIGAWGKSAVL